MKEPSLSLKILVVAGFSVSASAIAWLLLAAQPTHEFWTRLGWISALLSASAMLTVCWSKSVGYVARERGWPPRACYLAGTFLFVIPGLLIFLLADAPLRHDALFFLGFSNLAGYLCGKLAHPELTSEQALVPPPPLTLFPK